MKSILKIILLLSLSLSIAAGLWYYRPWSDFSPARLASLMEPENLPYTFQNMNTVFPSSTVAAGKQKKELPENVQPLKVAYSFNNKSKSLAQFIVESKTLGLLVLQDGVVVYEQYFLDADRQSLFTSWSLAKSFVATAVMIAVKEGRIQSVDDVVETYATQFAGSAYGKISLRNLLRMSSDIDFVEDYNSDDSDIRPFFFNAFIMGKNPDKLLLKFKKNISPNGEFLYLSPNSHVLSAVLRSVYQAPLAEIISQKIWQPLGMEADAYWLKNRADSKGVGLGYCCLNARLRDYARFGQFYLDAWHGKGNGVELLPSDWLHSLNVPPTPSHKPGGEKYQGRGYSSHFWLPPEVEGGESQGEFMAAGIYGQYIWVDEKNDIVIVRTSADDKWTPRQQESAYVMQAIVQELTPGVSKEVNPE